MDGGYNTWSSYEPCSETCGGPGTQTRTRKCDSPSQEHGGKDCTTLGPSTETQSCDMNMTCPGMLCPTNGSLFDL